MIRYLNNWYTKVKDYPKEDKIVLIYRCVVVSSIIILFIK